MSIRRIGDLDIAEDLDFQRRTWTVERIGWLVILFVVVAAVLGLCGSAGPLNKAAAGERDDLLSVSYARFARHGAGTVLEVRVAPEAARQGEVRLWIEEGLFEVMELTQVAPEPEEVVLEPGRLVFVFPAADAAGPLTISFDLEPTHYWRHTARLGLPDGPSVRVRQFVYP